MGVGFVLFQLRYLTSLYPWNVCAKWRSALMICMETTESLISVKFDAWDSLARVFEAYSVNFVEVTRERAKPYCVVVS